MRSELTQANEHRPVDDTAYQQIHTFIGSAPTPPERVALPPIKGPLIRISLIHHSSLIRGGLAAGMSHEAGIEVITAVADTVEAIQAVSTPSPDVIVISSLSSNNYTNSIGGLLKTFPKARIVVLDVPTSDKDILECIEAGAIGYVAKEGSYSDLIKVIRAVARGESIFSPQYTTLLCRRLATLRKLIQPVVLAGAAPLTPREQDIVGLVVVGLQNKEIASRLHIEPQTVKNHVHNVLHKLGVRNRYELARHAQLANIL